MKNFFKGIAFALAGIKCFYSDRTLWKYILPVWIIVSLLYIGLLRGTIILSGKLSAFIVSHAENWPGFLKTLLEAGLTVAAVATAALIVLTTFSTFFEAFGGVFFDKLTEKFEQKYFSSDFPPIPLSRQTAFTLQSLLFCSRTFIMLLVLSLLSLFLPAAGNVLLFVLMGRRMAKSLIFVPGFLRGKSLQESDEMLSGRQAELLGFGIAVYGLQLLPFSLPFTLPGLILGAAMFYSGRFPEGK